VPFAEPQAFTELGCVLVGDPNTLSAQHSADADCGVALLEALEPTRRARGSGAAPTLPASEALQAQQVQALSPVLPPSTR